MGISRPLDGLGGNFNNILKKIYYDVSNPAGFSAPYQLYLAAKKIKPMIKLKEVKHWLRYQSPYTLHKQIKLKFPRRMIQKWRIDEVWSGDLIQV